MSAPDQLSGVFIAPPVKVGGLELRPFSAGTLTVIRALGLNILGAEEGPLSHYGKLRQLVVFLFVQSQPIEAVKEAVRLAQTDLAAFEGRLMDFEFALPIASFNQVANQLERDLALISGAQVEVQPKPDDRPEKAPPNS